MAKLCKAGQQLREQIDDDLSAHKEEAYALVEKIRKCAKRGDKRIKYIIFDGKIMSSTLNWKRRKYRGPRSLAQSIKL